MTCEYVEGAWLDTANFILAALLFFSPILLGFRLKRKEIHKEQQGYWCRHFLPTFSTVLVVYTVAIYISVFLSSGIGLAFHAFGYALAGQTSHEPDARPEISKGGT